MSLKIFRKSIVTTNKYVKLKIIEGTKMHLQTLFRETEDDERIETSWTLYFDGLFT